MGKKNDNQLEKKFEKVLQMCRENITNTYAIAISSKDAVAYGLGHSKFKPYTALYFSNLSGKDELKGFINHAPISSFTNVDTTYITIDNRLLKKSVFYIKSGNKILRFNHKAKLLPKQKIMLYWEYGPYSCLVFIMPDLFSDNLIMECVFSENEDTQRANRLLFLNLLPNKEKEGVIHLFKQHLENSNTQDKGDINEV
ncbi:hypothetical protein [Bacillus ndiopicus]|uniref:hypothetical protein n=1 Tax=Bacillus ndiopicus TaxID=1347368 RepID=UPI0005AB323B|nr:hypothetical protein [Bacillus ndiopicus]